MANNYFDFLEQNAQQDKPANDAPQNDGTVNLTVRADAECQVVCDGDFLFLLDANQLVKEKAPVGQHLLQFISTDYPEICIEKEVDFAEPGKNYLVLVKEFHTLIADVSNKQKEEEEKAAEKKKEDHEWVDLGLSVKWATCNVGASSPSDYGSYFAWGETTPKSEYSWASLRYCADNSGDTFTKFNNVDNKSRLELGDDAARANWGGSWRMPTDAEWSELRQKCTWIWTEQGGKKGYKVTSKVNGNSIFLPAAGDRYDTSLRGEGLYGYYWSSSLYADYPGYAWYVYFSSDYVYRYYYSRYFGYSVRPVTE